VSRQLGSSTCGESRVSRGLNKNHVAAAPALLKA
jgi:hypothetical protein